MPRRPPPHIDAELTGRLAAIEIARAQLFDVDVDRKKRIDGLIDYFGTPPCMARHGGHCLDAEHSGLSNFEQI